MSLPSIDLTDEEAAFGFEVRESPTGVRVAVRTLAVGLEAVKRVLDDGTVEYAICDKNGQPLYAGARSLAELEKRFRT